MKWILGYYLIMSVITFFAFGLDKRRAVKGKWRISESSLHVMELLGGFPGAILGQRLFRHKTHKFSFLIITWALAIAHVLAWGTWWFNRS